MIMEIHSLASGRAWEGRLFQKSMEKCRRIDVLGLIGGF